MLAGRYGWMRVFVCCLAFSLVACSTDGGDPGAVSGSTLWTTVLASGAHDEASSVATDAHGYAYVAGSTRGVIAPSAGAVGSAQGFVARIAGDGSVSWIRQFGAAAPVDATAVAANADEGVFVAGRMLRSRDHDDDVDDDVGVFDAFVRKHASDGAERWVHQFGTEADDEVLGAAVDADGNVWLVGATAGDLAGAGAGGVDAFVRKLDGDGLVLWTRQFGTAAEDVATGVAVDEAGNGFVVGFTSGALGSAHGAAHGAASGAATDAFVRKYDPAGTVLWTRQFGAGSASYGDAAAGVAVDPTGRAVVVGSTAGVLAVADGRGGGLLDAFVRTYGASGDHVWTRQFGTDASDEARAVAVDARGRVFVAGSTLGAFEGFDGEGMRDVFVRGFDEDGSDLWMRQLGTAGDDFAHGAGVDAAGRLIVVGVRDAAGSERLRVVRDAFVMQLEP